MGLDIRLLENIFSSMTNSYKIYWFNSVFEEIVRGKRHISFKEVTVGMIVSAWYPIMTYRLNFGKQDKLEKIILKINNEYIEDRAIRKYDLYKYLIESEDNNLNKLISYFYTYVPYRLLTSFYEQELRGLKDALKNSKIEELCKFDETSLYKISTEKKEIYINDKWFNYIYENQNIIRGWIKYNLLDFIQARNPNVPAIIYKLESPIERNLSSAQNTGKK